MKKTIFSRFASVCLGAFMVINTISSTAFAFNRNEFESEDSLRRKIIESAMGERKTTILKSTRTLSEKGVGETERYIVCFKKTASLSEIKKALKGYSFRLLAESKERTFLVYLSKNDISSENGFLKKNTSLIDSAEKDELKTLSAFYPNDTYSGGYELEILEMQNTWEYGFGDKKIIIAVADSGIDRNHEDLFGANILPGYDYEKGKSVVENDATGHGTKVTGIIAARNNNGIGCAGIAPECTVLPLKITDEEGKIYTSDFIDSLYLAADSGANIINMSLGSYEKLESEEKAVKYAVSKGCILVAASGNEGNHSEYAGMKCYPASYDGVISVGAVDEAGKSCVFSQHNDAVDICAPGSGLALLQSGGGYTWDSGTSFSSAYISGVAALMLSALDDGIKATSDQFDYLISEHAKGPSGMETGAGIISPEKVIKYANYPLVSGVENGKVYYDNVYLYFNRGTAVLDGDAFSSGSLCKHTGEHVLTVTDGEKASVVKFTTDNIPLTCSLKDGDGYSYVSFSYGTATLNGFPYFSGDRITSDGKHTVVLTGPYGNTKTFEFNLSIAPPEIKGVENGEIYSTPKRINVATGGKIFLNGKEMPSEFTVFEEGQHTLLIRQNGNIKTSVNFIISYDIEEENDKENPYKYSVSDTSMSNAFGIYGNEVLVVWNNLNRGLRIFNKETLKLVKYINVGENVKDVHFGSKHLYICGTNHIFAIESEKITTTADLQKVYKFEFPVSSAEFHKDDLYVAESSSITSGNIKKISLVDFSNIEETDVCFLRSIPDVISYDEITDSIAFGKKEDGKVYVSPISGESMKMFSFESMTKNGFIFKNGKIAYGGNVFSVEKEKTVFSTFDSKALHFDGVNLTTEKGIYNTETFEPLGFHGIELSSVSFENGIYCAAFGDVSIYVSKSLPSAICNEAASSAGVGVGFTDHVYLSKNICGSLLVNGKIYAFGKENALYVFSESLEYISNSFLPFIPTGIETDGERLYIYSKDFDYIAVYNISDRKITIYNAPCKVEKLSVSSEYVSFVGNGSIYLYRKNGEHVWSDIDGEYVSAVLSKDGNNLYTVNSKSFYTTLTSFHLPSFEVEYERVLEYEATDIFCDNTYLYINTVAYLARNGGISASCTAKIYGRTFDTFVTAKGLFSGGKFISNTELSGDAFSFSDSGTLYLFSGKSVYMHRNVYGGDLGSMPEISGVENGVIYNKSVFPVFSKGMGFVDGKKIVSGKELSQGGNHILTVILPYGVKTEIRFSINASLSSLRIKGGDKAIKINDTLNLEVEFLPNGSPSEDIMFYTDSDIISVSKEGIVTGLKAGEAKVFAATIDGRVFTSAKISVLSSMLVFSPSYMEIDRTNGILFKIPSGMTVSSLINSLDVSLRENTVVYDGEKNASGIVKTGMKIALLGKNGDILDSLLISVMGDCNGDGDVDVGDLVEASFLSGKTDAEAVYIKSADFSNTGAIDVADLFTYKEIILGNEKTVSVANTVKSPFQKELSIDYEKGKDGTINVYILSEDETIKGISGKIKYETENLTFISANKTGYVHGAEEQDGEIVFLTAFSKDEQSEKDSFKGKTILLSLSFLPKTDKNIVLSSNSVIVYTENGEKKESKKADSSSIIISQKKQEETTLKELSANVGSLIPEFSENVFSYALRLPFGTESVDFYSKGEKLQCVGNENLKDGSVITVLYNGFEYKITVFMESTQRNDNHPHWKVILFSVIGTTAILSVLVIFLFRKTIKKRFSEGFGKEAKENKEKI